MKDFKIIRHKPSIRNGDHVSHARYFGFINAKLMLTAIAFPDSELYKTWNDNC
jgi:hypothetical protein